jgi:hypothetical protein
MRNGKSGTGYMELNTINKTGTWSETADRINSNFSKISIEVEEIKQNGGGGSGGGGDVTNADHATSAYTLDKNTPVLDWFLSALNDDDAQGIINYLKGLKIAGNLINRIVKQGDKDVTYTDEDVMSALRVMTEIENSEEKLKEIFLRKNVADSTKFLLSMFAGAVFGKNGFASGLTGFGAKIFDTGHGEFESMFIRRFLEVPELRYNRVMVTLGDKWRAPGAGIIETVDTGTKTCTLKLEDGEIGAVAVGDICMGIYHNITGNATEDYDDGKGNRRFAGFCTVYFTITEVTGERNETFKYQLRPTSSSWSSSFDPFEMMTFVAYGSFTNTERQTSVYETRTYTRMLWKQNTWEISAANVALQYGDLSNLNIFGLNMDGYSMYLNNIYMTGIIKQIKPDGTPVQPLNFREEGYIPDVHYDYYDSLSYNGSMWACINEDGSSSVPGSNGDWLEIASKGDTGTPGAPGKDGVSVTNSGPWYSGLVVPKMGVVSMGGGSYVAKASTTNPPLWCWTDNAGNRFTFSDGGYCLTGDVNTAEYDVWAEKGEPGKDGVDGKPGEDGKDGVQGIQGCIIRNSEWTTGVTYRNDESLTSGTRYIDIVMVRNNSAVDGWDVYKCIKTHTSSSSITYTNTTYWTELSNVGPIYTSLIIAKNASLDFVQGNELLIKDANNNVVAGLTGGSSKEAGTTPVRIWAGGKVPGSAPFRVDQEGNLVASKANITGTISATGGTIGPFSISSSKLSSRTLYESETNKYVGFNLSAQEIEFYNERTGANVKIGGDTKYTLEGLSLDAGINIQSSNALIGMHIKTLSIPLMVEGGNIYLHPDTTSNTSIHGLVLNARVVNTSVTLNDNDDIISFTNSSDITVKMPNHIYYGKVLFMKKYSGNKVTLTGGTFVSSNSAAEISTLGLDRNSMMFIGDARGNWIIYYCG